MDVGVIKWFDNAKGWGFIIGSEGGDVFIHYREIQGTGYRVLRKGQKVRYKRCKGPRGDFATQVEPLDDATDPASTSAVPGLAKCAADATEDENPFASERRSGVVPRGSGNGQTSAADASPGDEPKEIAG